MCWLLHVSAVDKVYPRDGSYEEIFRGEKEKERNVI